VRGRLDERWVSGLGVVERDGYLAWPVAQLVHLLFVPRELTIELLNLNFDRAYARIRL
jgi:hypothetical protein